jgi:transcriptional regulator with XRE-family HTH domain
MTGKYLALPCPHCGGRGAIMAQTMGHRVRALRHLAGLTQNELASRIGNRVSGNKIGDIETGYNRNPPLVTLRALAEVFGVTVGYLVDGDGPWDPLA